jgi:hypothetical protein
MNRILEYKIKSYHEGSFEPLLSFSTLQKATIELQVLMSERLKKNKIYVLIDDKDNIVLFSENLYRHLDYDKIVNLAKNETVLKCMEKDYLPVHFFGDDMEIMENLKKSINDYILGINNNVKESVKRFEYIGLSRRGAAVKKAMVSSGLYSFLRGFMNFKMKTLITEKKLYQNLEFFDPKTGWVDQDRFIGIFKYLSEDYEQCYLYKYFGGKPRLDYSPPGVCLDLMDLTSAICNEILFRKETTKNGRKSKASA